MVSEKEKLQEIKALNAKGILRLYSEVLKYYTYFFIVLFASFFFIMLLVRASHNSDAEVPLLFVVGSMGAFGAFFSALARLYSLKELPSIFLDAEFSKDFTGTPLLFYCLIRPFTGIIASLLFYIIIASGIVAGDLFPKFSCSLGENLCNTFVGTFDYAPNGPTDIMKSLVWGFIAGFSERLVPDVIAQTEKSVSVSNSKEQIDYDKYERIPEKDIRSSNHKLLGDDSSMQKSERHRSVHPSQKNSKD